MSEHTSGGRRIAVVGAGIVGVRATRELLAPLGGLGAAPAPPRPVLVTRRRDRADQLRSSFGDAVEVRTDDRPLPADVGTVVVTRGSEDQLEVATEQLRHGRDVICTADATDAVTSLLGLHDAASSAGVALVVGAAMSPGWSCLLAAHAATLFDEVDELHVARDGAAGPACARQRLRALRGTALDRRDGAWVRRAGFSGRELVWFPDPIGGRDCYRADLCEPLLLVPAFPSATRITARLAATRRDRTLAPFPVLLPPPTEGGPGAIRVEIRGVRDGERHTVIYGALDRPGVAAGAVAAVSALRVASGDRRVGAHGLAALGGERDLLVELARRGVRAAAFEGAHPLAADVGEESQDHG